MTSKKETFSTLLKEFEHRYELRSVFDDFLTLTICAFSQNPHTKKSYDEELYMEIIGKYKEKKYSDLFPKLLTQLILEMEEKLGDNSGNDVLGDFFEQELSRGGNGQFFTPWHVCMFMAKINHVDYENEEHMIKRLNILDPACGSGRMLLAGAMDYRHHNFYGIDIDHTCVKMATINLFLNGVFHAEVMWANALDPSDFRMSYIISLLPFGIFRISEREKSPLWNMHQNSFNRKMPDFDSAPNLIQKIHKEQGGSQLVLL